MMRTVLAVLAHSAHADDRTAAIKTVLEAQRKALLAGKTDALKATLTADAVMNLEGDKPTTDIETWSGSLDVTKLSLGDFKIGWAGSWGWAAGEARRTSVLIAAAVEAGDKPSPYTLHWVELFVPDGSAVKGKVLFITAAKPDKDLTAFNYAQELVARMSATPAVALLYQPADEKLADDAAVTVLGTSATDRGLGVAAAKKLVAGWKKLALEVVDTKEEGRKHDYEPFELAVGDATVAWARLRMKLPGQKKWIPITGFVIAKGTEIVALSYSAD